ncbi:MAG: aminotransferase class V-fold PLP-dependent enzyme [Bacteroidia bacterium]|nr:aminotransferase class V-fold PLP-dependent enzyme [Bacteroidia bacterium]
MKRKEVNSSRMPVYRDSGFELYDAGTTSGAFKKETEHEREPDNYIYSRYRNPTVVSAEEEIMKLEGCSWALLTQSGMSAIDTALSVFQHGKETKPWLFFTEIYGGTISFIESVLKKRRGLDIHYFTPDNGKYDLNEFEKVVSRLKPEFVYIESISNPMLIVADVTEITRTAKKHGSKVIIDNTFATPWLYKPLDEGVDIVIHSATKYFSGHGNLTAGVICGNDKKIMQSAIEYRKFVGHMLSPDDAYRLQTQIQSFELRFSRQCDNASKLAEHLSRVPVIKKVWFPGLKSHFTHIIAEKLFGGKGFGAMITFDFDGKDENEKRGRRDKFIKLVSEKIKLIPTLGDPNTILMPVEAVWGIKYPEPGMIRLSVGFEDYSELEATITKALEGIEKG